jgi:hypothetical protein
MIFIGMGGAGPYLSAFHVCQLFKENARIATSILVGCMIGSALLSLILAEIIAAGVSHQIVFGAHFIWVILMSIINYFLQPPKSIFNTKIDVRFVSPLSLRYDIIHYPEQDATQPIPEYATSLAVNEKKVGVYELVGILVFPDDELHPNISDLESAGSKVQTYNSLMDVCQAPAFWIMMIFLNIHMLRFNFFLATALTHIDNNGGGNLYVTLLFILVPLLGFISNVLFVPEVIRRFGIGGVLWVAQLLGLGYGVLLM